MRTYEGNIKLPPNDRSGNHRRTMFGIRRGLKIVHIGDDVWRIGKEKEIEGKGVHQVIYSPNGQEYHIWNNDVFNLRSEDYVPSFQHNNYADQSKVKIYILTKILDHSENWCFNLDQIPENGPLKVIYNNGTVKNIVFENAFTKNKIIRKNVEKILTPIAYRIK